MSTSIHKENNVQKASNSVDKSKDHVFVDFQKCKDQVSIDFEKIANSLKGEFDTLCPPSEDCCIFQIPSHIRMLNESLYTPKVVSIGPLHHHREELNHMEKDKLRYLKQFLGRTSLGMVDFLRYIKFKEAKLRKYYAESIKYESEDFVKMILVDAVFLIEMFLRYIPEFQSKDRVFTNPGLINDIVFDILLLENQLPIFILEELFVLAQLKLPKDFEGDSLSQFVGAFFEFYVCQAILIDDSLIERYFSEAKHFVDLLWLCLRPSHGDDIKRRSDSEDAPNITKLYQFGMKFKVASKRNMLDITFNKSKRTLEIPKLIMSNMTVHLLRNLQIFESLYYRDFNYINDYHMILNRFLSTPKDVELLVQSGVIENRILNSKGVSTFFQEFGKDARVHYDKFYYSSLVEDLRDYLKSRRRQWKAFFKLNYLTNPWIFASVIAASTMLILTFLQTLFTIIK